jgi:N-sulfoglucosamine sulfohydrolase
MQVRWLLFLLICPALSYSGDQARVSAQGEKQTAPNIIWLVLDDASENLGCYGDPQAITPQMDRLAKEGVRFTRAFAHAPVCAPSRSGLITGMYPTTLGSHHMRSRLIAHPEVFTSLLRKSGYYVAWPGKTDFNFDGAPKEPLSQPVMVPMPEGGLDSNANWLTQPPPRQPFFAYLNLGITHESQVRGDAALHARNTARLKPGERHDPAQMKIPAYYPDAPEIRKDLAQYYDLMTAADYQVGEVLAWLEKNKLAENTVVILFADHGRGMPRAKRWLYDSGIKVPLIIRWPTRLKAGSVRDDLVSFIDFAPTMLSLAGAEIPQRMQGQVFLGPQRARDREYIYAARDRMDEVFDRIRAVRDRRFKYLRNFRPDLPYAQRLAYNEENPTMQAWRRLSEAGKLTGPAALFFAPVKPEEELYDTLADPDEVNNLATDPKYQKVLLKMRAALDRWIIGTKDLGEIPEEELIKRGIVVDVLKDYAKLKAN